MIINTETKLFAILGYPVKHSLSPQMQNEWFKKENLNCIYLAFESHPDYLEETVKSLKLLKFYGVNITVPHKIEIMKYVDFLDEAAKKVGSVNTLDFKNNKIYGYNTDYLGFSQDLLAKEINLKNKNVLVIGAGGAARAIVYALKNSEAGNIYISNRTLRGAQQLANIFKLNVFDITKVKELLPEIDLLVNASSCGLKKSDVLPFNDIVRVKSSLVIYDLIFNKVTPFVKFAKRKKLKVFTGEGMLARQGACGFKIWTGKYPDIKFAETFLKKFVE
ncbi:MAG: shikimate dehydrogenase [Endomicrobium sp.]|jgi:shikimate dehydrogenase|nr:shikimate dehydrogenase [Endomicrobium sp.]